MNKPELQGAVILIVDDQPENLGVLFDYFHKFECTVLVSENGEDALEIVKDNTPDIILLDILMPGIGGFETCRRLKADEKTREIPVLFVSSLSETVDKVRAFELGAVDFITKPFQTEEVLARVAAHLGYHRLKQDVEHKNRRLQEEIAQHQLTERALEHARDAANSANRAKSVFLSNMSHELRTPLNGVLGYAQILSRDDALSKRQKEAVTTILSSGRHLLTLIEEILEFSKIETQKIKLAPQHFRLPEFLYGIADSIRGPAFRKGLDFVVNIAPDLPLIVCGDPKRIRQILVNILNNSVKFTQQGSVEFRAAAKRWSHEPSARNQGLYLRVEIKDSGPGIPEHRLSDIFEPFKTTGDRYTQTEGTGLSLATSRYLAHMMGGEISVESTPGQGAIFYIDLELSYSNVEDSLEKLKDESGMEHSDSESQNLEGPPPEALLVFPPADELDVLLKAATIGDIIAVREWVNGMKGLDERLLPFIKKIDRWAQSFDIGSLQKFLRATVEKKG